MDMKIDQAWRMPDGNVLAFSLYPGCEECFRGIGVVIYVFDKEGERHWLGDVETPALPKADEFGGNEGMGISIPIVDIDKILDHARAIDVVDDDISDYETTADFLDDKLQRILHWNSRETVATWRKSGSQQ